jgi:hypothetical protein
MAGAIVIAVILLIIPVTVIMSGAAVAAILGHFLKDDAAKRNADSELLDLNV